MKAVFPCTGTVILTKSDVDKLHNFYLDNLKSSKLLPIYNQSNYSIQEGNLTYLPQNTNIVLENAHFLSLSELHAALSKTMNKIPEQTIDKNNFSPLDDNFILNHPFFETLTPLN